MKVAIIGFGSIGNRHLKNLLKLGIQNIVIVSEHLSESEFIFNGKIFHVVNDIKLVINSIDIMVISNPTNQHFKYLNLAIANKVNAYIEKPIACNLDQVNEISKIVPDNEIILAVGTQFRFNKLILKLKELIDNDYFGHILSVVSSHGEHIADYHPGENYKSSYTANKNQCGGVLLTQIHHIDYLEWLFGPFTHAFANEIVSPSLEIDVDAVINFSLVCSETNLQVHGHMNYLQRPKSTTLSIIGESASAFWNSEENTISLVSNQEIIKEQIHQERNEMFLMAMNNFIDSIKSSSQPAANIGDGIRSIKIVECIKRSISSGQVEKIT